MKQFVFLLAALALTLGPVRAGGEECEGKCEEGKECEDKGGECCEGQEACKAAFAGLDAAAKARAEALAAVKVMPEDQRKKIDEAAGLIKSSCPMAKSMSSSMAAMNSLLAAARAIDAAEGVKASPRTKLTAAIGDNLSQVCAIMLQQPAAPASAKEPAVLAEEALKQAEAAEKQAAGAQEELSRVPAEQVAKVKEAYAYVSANCPVYKSMGVSMMAIVKAFDTLEDLSAMDAGQGGKLGELRQACLERAGKMMESMSGQKCCDEDGEGCCEDEGGECPVGKTKECEKPTQG